MTRRRTLREHITLVGALALLIAASAASRASAHAFEPALFLLREQAPGIFTMTWRAPSGSVDSPARGQTLAPRLPSHCRPMDRPGPMNGEPQVEMVVPSLWDCGALGLRGATVAVDGLEASPADVIVQITWGDGAAATGVLQRSDPQFVVPGLPGGSAGPVQPVSAVFARYFSLGTQHILFGIDHLMFVLGLMLLVSDLAMLLKTITAFTLAHSITLALAVLGVVHVAPAAVEACIALSIVLLAVEVARAETGYMPEPTVARQFPWVIAFVFGLLHGLGFAGALAEIGLPPGQIAISLVAFNLGVEAGQLAFVLALLLAAAAWARLGYTRHRVRLVSTYVMGVVAIVWTFERLGWLWSALAS
jgi:hypothetical protein